MLELSRRALLRTAAGGVGGGAAAALAGCSSLPDPTSHGPFGDVAPPARGPAGYRNLVPERSPGDLPLVLVSRIDVSALDRSWLSPETVARLVSQARRGRDYLGLARGAVDAVSWLGFEVAVVRGRFSRASVGRTLVRGGYERAGDHAGFAAFERPDGERSAAVGPGAVVWTGESTPASYATRVVDAARDEAPRLADSDDAFRLLTGKLGTGTVTRVVTQEEPVRDTEWLPGRVGSASATTYTPGGTYSTSLVLFGDEPPSVDAVRDQLRTVGDGEALESYRRVEVHRGDRTVRIDGLLADDAVTGGGDRPRPPVVPRVTFGFDRDPDAGTVTVTHEAGDAALARRLTVAGLEPTDRQFADRYVTVSPGDDLTVEPEATTGMLRVTWEADSGSRTAIGRFPLSEEGDG